MNYRRDIRIEFNHCDPAGIVFYPRYFEMTNSVAENFFRDVAGHSYDAMMAQFEGVPTARLEADFHAPSRLGEVLEWRLKIDRLGGSSIAMTLTASVAGAQRVTVRLALVFVSAASGKPVPKAWPEPIRTRIATFMEADDA